MSNTPVDLKIAGPYARALFEFASETSVLHGVTADFNNLYSLLRKTPDLIDYLNQVFCAVNCKEHLI